MAAFNSKYANLPDLDLSPDVYETPDLTSDNGSTAPTANSPPLSPTSPNNDIQPIDRRRLNPDSARTYFEPAVVSAENVDFSDRIGSKRKSYRVSTRRRIVRQDGTEELGDVSDEEDESLEHRIARLKREVEEAKAECEKRTAESEERQNDDVEAGKDRVDAKELESLSTTLSTLSTTSSRRITTSASLAAKLGRPMPQLHAAFDDGSLAAAEPPASQSAAQFSSPPTLYALAQVEGRLTALETALGIPPSGLSSDPMPTPPPIIPTLMHLSNQLSVISSASPASLDALARRTRQLAAESVKLADARKRARELEPPSFPIDGDPKPSDGELEDKDSKIAKLNALYNLLPQIASLTPILPPLLDRLRSLKAIHGRAAGAEKALDEMEKKQEDLQKDLKNWTEGLAKLEQRMQDGEALWKGNLDAVESWVKELEERTAQIDKTE